MCTKIGYEFYCKELFIVRNKSKYSCESVIYFYLGFDIIKENCNFAYYFNNIGPEPEPQCTALMCDTEKSVGGRVKGNLKSIEKKATINKIKETTNVFSYFYCILKNIFFI